VRCRALRSSRFQVGVWIPALAECALVLANNGLLPAGWNEHVLRLITGTPLRTLAARTLPPVLLAGASLAALGTSIRIAAYDALGKQFTYEVAIRDDYALVTTFPYTLVRHPSYLGSAATIAGVGCMLAPWDGWARAVFVPWLVSRPRTLGKVAAGAAATGFVGFNLLTLVMFHSRAGAEDRMLRRQFGRRWDEWAERVPNQIIPYVW
jgi:protein-S-isoprenylcysteine O-methyltransferase Ste14